MQSKWCAEALLLLCKLLSQHPQRKQQVKVGVRSYVHIAGAAEGSLGDLTLCCSSLCRWQACYDALAHLRPPVPARTAAKDPWDFQDDAKRFVAAHRALKHGKLDRSQQLDAFVSYKEAARAIAEKMSGGKIDWVEEEARARSTIKRSIVRMGEVGQALGFSSAPDVRPSPDSTCSQVARVMRQPSCASCCMLGACDWQSMHNGRSGQCSCHIDVYWVQFVMMRTGRITQIGSRPLSHNSFGLMPSSKLRWAMQIWSPDQRLTTGTQSAANPHHMQAEMGPRWSQTVIHHSLADSQYRYQPR